MILNKKQEKRDKKSETTTMFHPLALQMFFNISL